ncbi:hypothetical protein BH09MYX1_BH09MYX1_28170 [soil metagenome]
MSVRAVCIVGFVALSGCTAVLGEDFTGYVGRPSLCDPRAPQTGDPTAFVRCDPNQTCQFGTPSGAASLTETHCYPSVDPPKEIQGSCKYGNDCGAGLTCTDYGCVEFCTVGASCSGGRGCLAFAAASTVGTTEIGYCALADCDPHAATCTASCTFYTMTRTACTLSTGSSAQNGACSRDTDCKRSLACDDSVGRCAKYCRVGTADCGAGVTCSAPAASPLEWNGTKYGFCP